MNDTNPAIQPVLILILSSVSERYYSLQEVVHILKGLAMYYSSHEVTSIYGFMKKSENRLTLQVMKDHQKPWFRDIVSNQRDLSLTCFFRLHKYFSVKEVEYHGRRKDAAVKFFLLYPSPAIRLWQNKILWSTSIPLCPWIGNSYFLYQEGRPPVHQSSDEAFNDLSIDTYE